MNLDVKPYLRATWNISLAVLRQIGLALLFCAAVVFGILMSMGGGKR